MANILPKGTEVRCPRKRHLIGVTNRQLNSGDQLRFTYVDFEPGQERIAGEHPECKLCSSRYFVQGKMHTSEGWKPSDPTLEPVALK